MANAKTIPVIFLAVLISIAIIVEGSKNADTLLVASTENEFDRRLLMKVLNKLRQ
jgi:hypothetical protein